MIIPMFSYLDTTENVPHLVDGRVAGRKVALRTSAPRKTTEIGVEESALEAGTAAGPGPETGKEPGESLQTCGNTAWRWAQEWVALVTCSLCATQ